MHSPETLAFEIRFPWRRSKTSDFRAPFITIWHVDPCKSGSDNSCGWHMRSWHGDRAVLDRIVKSLEFDWDRTWTNREPEYLEKYPDAEAKTYLCGLFRPDGHPNHSVMAIVLNAFHAAAWEHFKSIGRPNDARKFLRKYLFDILLFAENPVDSLRDSITLKYGNDQTREERISGLAASAYAWILNESRPWYRHPRWHIRHWQIQIHPLEHFKRWAFSRCKKCGGRFKWGESVVCGSWDSDGPQWFKSEPNIWHSSQCKAADRSAQ